MSIQKKLLLSNIFMIVIPLVVALITLSVFIIGPGAQSWETMANLFRDKNGVFTAQSLMQTLDLRGDLDVTLREMTAAGYHFEISVNGEVQFSNMTPGDTAVAKAAVGPLYDDDSNYAVTKGKTFVVRYNNAEDNYTATAVHTQEIPRAKHRQSYMEWYIALYVGFLVLIIVGSVMLMNVLMSWWIAQNILSPLKRLCACSQLIREGHLDFELTSDKKDEMGEMIRGFDEMRRHLQASVEERMEYEQYRKELINGISHDLRTPLTSIRGYVEGLRDGIANTPEKKSQYYGAIETSVKGLENLVDNLTNFSKVEMGQSHLEMLPTDLGAYVSGAAEKLREEYGKDRVAILTQLPADTVTVLLDKKEMDRVFRNLLDNTVKYRTRDTSAVTVTVEREGDAWVTLRFSDDGPGVREEELDKIFTCFYRGDEARTYPASGSGVGLAVVKQLVCQQGGSVYAENDGGLAVVIKLPVYREGKHGT